jgi:NADH-quinone oxidoreductase subunit F
VDLERAEDRVRDFREVEKGFPREEEVRREAKRCLRCDLERERR